MRYPILLALGALLLALPATAQTITIRSAEKKHSQKIERHIEVRSSAENGATIEITVDSLDAASDAADRRSDSLDAVSDSLDAVNDSLDEANAALDEANASLDEANASLDEANAALDEANASLEGIGDGQIRIIDITHDYAANPDSLRGLVCRQIISTRGADSATRQLNEELQAKMREIRHLRILVQRDTIGLARELETAQRSIEAAQRSIDSVTTDISFFTSDADHSMKMEMGNAANGDHQPFVMVTQTSDSDHSGRAYHVIINQLEMKNIVNRAFSNYANGSNFVYQRLCNDSVRARVPMPPLPPLPPMPPMPPSAFTVNGELVTLDADSIRVIDGKDMQTIIRINSDSSRNGRHSCMITITSRSTSHPAAQSTTVTSTMESPAAIAIAKSSAPMREDAAGHTLAANRPNPFSTSTTISFTLPRTEHATLSVFDANGTLVKTLTDETLEAGEHSVSFDPSGLPSGTYLYRLVAGSFNETKTMTLEK